ncbi:helix-turn-helix domain-containing protein [Pseudonocardia spinosispora]|uniref:helix-turn-helix domain-containing protein n=1 Tax=Pseudonocardia spinosispora TaxID=103441 RepID=UPI00041283A9|nr:XRE family transcriptional regulator [Pseudonocardia spinosispora]
MVRNTRAALDDETEPMDRKALGATVRSIRSSAGLTMSALAQRAGVTQPYVSQLERGAIAPSLATLYRLGAALGVPPTALLPSVEGPVGPVVRSGGGEPFAQSDAQPALVGRRLTGGGGVLEAVEYDLSLSDRDDTAFVHPGEEFLYVLDGRLEFRLDGMDWEKLGQGDSVRFDAGIAHQFGACDDGGARVLLVAAHSTHPVPPGPS